MDEVQRFINENQHQLGYIMEEASRKWIEKDPHGALTVGPCNVFIQTYGDWHEVYKKMDIYRGALRRIESHKIGLFTYSDMRDIAREALKIDQ